MNSFSTISDSATICQHSVKYLQVRKPRNVFVFRCLSLNTKSLENDVYTLLLCYVVTYYLKILHSRLVFFESGQKYDVDYERSHAYNMAGRGAAAPPKMVPTPHCSLAKHEETPHFRLIKPKYSGSSLLQFSLHFSRCPLVGVFLSFYKLLLQLSFDNSDRSFNSQIFFSIIGHSA